MNQSPISFQKFLREIPLSATTGWRYRKLGWLRCINIAGRSYITQEAAADFLRRAKAGEFQRAPHGAAAHLSRGHRQNQNSDTAKKGGATSYQNIPTDPHPLAALNHACGSPATADALETTNPCIVPVSSETAAGDFKKAPHGAAATQRTGSVQATASTSEVLP